jgi:hypothetical protein
MKKMSNEFRNKYKAETWEIVNTLERDRKLTKTQKKLVKLIKKEIK